MSLAKPRGFLTNGFDLLADDGSLLGAMEGSLWGEGGQVRVGGDTWELRRRGWTSFRLVDGHVDEAVARSRGMLSSKLDVEHASSGGELARQSMWRRAYDLRQSGVVLAVVAIQWRRQSSAAT